MTGSPHQRYCGSRPAYLFLAVLLSAHVAHVIIPVTIEGIGIKGPTIGLGIGLMWGDDGGYGSP